MPSGMIHVDFGKKGQVGVSVDTPWSTVTN
jgi:hypothetical protein